MGLLDVLNNFRKNHPTPGIEITSVWMDTDEVDFSREPYDCAILLGNGHFGEGSEDRLLFSEWLIPVCSPAMLVSVANPFLTATSSIPLRIVVTGGGG